MRLVLLTTPVLRAESLSATYSTKSASSPGLSLTGMGMIHASSSSPLSLHLSISDGVRMTDDFRATAAPTRATVELRAREARHQRAETF